jgi:hypothetical protein
MDLLAELVIGRHPRDPLAVDSLSREFGFCPNGFAPTPEIQLAVGQQPVYNPALRCFR